MKLALVMLISIAGLGFGADPKPKSSTEPPATDQPSEELRRLDSVTWDLKTHTLSWVVQHGKLEKGEFVPTIAQHYEITPDDATMGAAGAALERRPMDEDEAKLLHQLLDTLSIYCARSVVRWEQDTTSDPAGPNSTPSLKPDRPPKQDGDPAPKPVPPKPVNGTPLRVGEPPVPR